MLTALPQFGFIEIRGVDAEKFFQGYCTRDLSQLGNGLAMYTAIPTIQGRVLSTRQLQDCQTRIPRMKSPLVASSRPANG